VSLLGSTETVNLNDPSSFNIGNGPWRWRDAQRTALREIYQQSGSWLHGGGLQALDAMDIVNLNINGGYIPENGAVYPDHEFGEQLQVLAQMIKLDLGLQVATVDLGGWDTHDAQGDGSNGYFADLVAELAGGLGAFYQDLDGGGSQNHASRVTVVVQSEFGRELYENGDAGTEHGYGNLMLVLGGNVNGGFHGQFPGLAPGQLVDETDLGVTTDYRQILSEILVRRQGNAALDVIFPNYQGYEPLGIVQGTDIQDPGGSIFTDGFEGGTADAWGASVG
ncbi:MAG: DUF1501 domain-containing protein, partial [Acidobacteriota bacterium]